jgi:hypothetical protein
MAANGLCPMPLLGHGLAKSVHRTLTVFGHRLAVDKLSPWTE